MKFNVVYCCCPRWHWYDSRYDNEYARAYKLPEELLYLPYTEGGPLGSIFFMVTGPPCTVHYVHVHRPIYREI